MSVTKIKISHRLLLLCGAYMLPIAVLAFFALKGVGMPIEFGRQELLGNQYQRPLEKLLKFVPLHGILIKEQAAEVKGADSELRSNEASIDDALKVLQETDNAIGKDLQFTDEALRKAGREQAKVPLLSAKWEDLKTSASHLDPTESDKRHTDIVTTIQAMIAHSGDKSNLILDPDLDSYYIMDITLLALPQTQARIANIVATGGALLTSGQMSEAARVELSVDAAMLREADISRINADAETALKEDENFYGKRESLQGSIPPLVKSYADATEEFAKVIERMASGEVVPYETFMQAGNKARDTSFRLWDVAVVELDGLLNTRVSYFVGVKWWTVGPSLLAVMLAWALGWYLSTSITRPFEGIMTRLSETCKQLGSGANQMSAASQALAQRATEQAASLEETAASLEEISSVSKHNTDNSQQAHRLAESVREAAYGGVKSMTAMTEAIHSIKKSADETAQIVKIIDEIAFQTNLLALNAAVEAARAGDAGKGFAVVAEEVRNLAQRSANAAKDSSEKIRQSKELADNGVKVTEEVAKSLENINQNAVKSADLMKEIAAASKEQTSGITQINLAVTELDKVTQQNSAAAEESSAAGEELTAQAGTLDQVVENLSSLVYGGAAPVENEAPQPTKASRKRNSPQKTQVTYLRPAEDANFNQSFGQYSNGQFPSGSENRKPTQIIPLDDNDFQGF